MQKILELSFENSALLDKTAVEREVERIKPYLARLRSVLKEGGYDTPEASLNLVCDKELRDDIANMVRDFSTPFLKYVIVIGIGGSDLGTRAIYTALRGPSDAYTTSTPKLLFLDTNNGRLLMDTIDLLKRTVTSPDEVVLNIISKSGNTTETLANFEVLYDFLKKHLGDTAALHKQIVVTTNEGSVLWKAAEKHRWGRLSIPLQVGGRYSVFSAVGLLPLALIGTDIQELHRGALEMHDECLIDDPDANPALASALAIYLHYKSGQPILNTFLFNAELEGVGKWYRQLMGESLGKEHDRDGNVVNIGITPITSIGSTDLHSMAQLYLGGPRDKFTVFIHSLEDTGIVVPKDPHLYGLLPVIAGKDVHEIMRAILEGVQIAYRKQNLPYVDIKLAGVNERSLGALLQMKMREMMILAELLNLNAFDQPNVEAYKSETKKILEAA